MKHKHVPKTLTHPHALTLPLTMYVWTLQSLVTLDTLNGSSLGSWIRAQV
jgi:hypothetical protein